MTIINWLYEVKFINILKKGVPIPNDYQMSLLESTPGNKYTLWTICDSCGAALYKKHLKANLGMCPDCNYHFQLTSDERISLLIDENTWIPLNEYVSPKDPLKFRDYKSYRRRLRFSQDVVHIQDAVQTGVGFVDGIPVAIGVMDFNFMGGSMGSVVGEKLTRLIEYATKNKLYLLIVCASGGARMQEGSLSLMQMAKISAALHIYQNIYKLFYISICTSPTTGGITASFAMLGDVILAEPKALIAFAGRRVIASTLGEELPTDFQTSEYLLKFGQLDAVVSRNYLKEAISELFHFFRNTIYTQKPVIYINNELYKSFNMYQSKRFGISTPEPKYPFSLKKKSKKKKDLKLETKIKKNILNFNVLSVKQYYRFIGNSF
uniref:AccD n=1 Tax=Prototheca tumulicola TaxID=1737639 RepID=UPI003002BFE3